MSLTDWKVTRMQCINCERRLAYERAQDGSDPQVCAECRKNSIHAMVTEPGIPLADEDDGPPMDPAEVAYYNRLAAVVRPKGLTIEIKRGQEGPPHDPYGWREFHVKVDDRTVMYREGILSERLVLESPRGRIEFTSPDYDQEPTMKVLFEDYVGFPMDQLDYWFNEDWCRDEFVRDAEIRAGWDPSP